MFVQPLFSNFLVLSRGATDHVKKKCPGSRRKSNEWNRNGFFLHLGANLSDGLQDVAQFVFDKGLVDFFQGRNAGSNLLGACQWLGYQDSNASGHGDLDSEGFGNDQNVRKENGGVDLVSADGLEGAFGDALGLCVVCVCVREEYPKIKGKHCCRVFNEFIVTACCFTNVREFGFSGNKEFWLRRYEYKR